MLAPANPVSVVTASVAFREIYRDSVVVPSDRDCDYDEIAEVASSADLAGDITGSVASLADPVSVVTDGVAFWKRCGDSFVIPSD